MLKHIARTTLFVSVSTLALAPIALAQPVTGVSGQVAPGQIEHQYRIQEQRPAVGGAPIIEMKDEHGNGLKSGMQFTLKTIAIENGTVYGESELKHLYADKLGKKITVGELNQIAADITSYYRNNGYILTRAVVPPQRIADGNVKIRIIEGFVSNVKFEGDGAADKQVQAYADKIRASKPLDAKVLERYLLLMDDLPGIEARAVLQPSPDTQGASEVVVTITRKPYEFSATIDNRGSKFLGPEQLGLTGSANNMIGLDDQTQVRLIDTINDPKELVFGEIRHEEQLGSEGTKLVLSFNQVRTKPGGALEILDIDGTSTAASIGVSHPIKRSRRSNWFVNGDFTWRNVDVNQADLPLYYDKTRVLSAGTAYDFVDSTSAINRMDFNVAEGLGIGTDVRAQPRSRANADPTFTKIYARVSRIQPISGPWSAYLVGAGQYSWDPLVASEEFALGGTEFGSAFDSAELTGDHGAAGRFEMQYNQAPGMNWLQQYQVYAFYDIGRVWNIDRNAGEEAHQSLSSTGIGARFNLNDQFSGNIEGALPLVHTVAANGGDGSDPRLFLSLQYRY